MANDIEKACELSENDMAKISAGRSDDYVFPNQDGSEFDHLFRFKVGEHVEYVTGTLLLGLYEFTDGGTVVHRSHDWNGIAVYRCRELDSHPEIDWIYEANFQ